jgi:Ferritin-like domain
METKKLEEVETPWLKRRGAIGAGVLGLGAAYMTLKTRRRKHSTVVSRGGDAQAVDKEPSRVVDDVVLARTVTSLALLAAEAHKVVKANVGPALQPVVDTIIAHHQTHAALFAGITTRLGGQPATSPNAVVFKNVVEPAAATITDEATALKIAHVVESTWAATYQSMTNLFSTPQLRQSAMTASGSLARHAALIASVLPTNSYLVDSLAPVVDEAAAQSTTAEQAPVIVLATPFASVAGAFGPNSFDYPPAPAV